MRFSRAAEPGAGSVSPEVLATGHAWVTSNRSKMELAPILDLAGPASAGALREPTLEFGISLGDRACLALAIENGETILTADRIWERLSLGVGIEVIR